MTNPDDMIIRCLHCGTKNRIPAERLHDRPTCGQCHAPLDDMIITCLHCGTKNRMPENRLHDRPLCGRCRTPLVLVSNQDRPVEVTDASFAREVLESPQSVLVDCWAPWCGPCKTITPMMDELAVKYAGGIKIAKLNVDENPLTASTYGIRNIPTLLFFRDGQAIDRIVGALPMEQIEQRLRSAMKTN